jgi:hypothetical protein
MSTPRAGVFEDDLSDFAPKPRAPAAARPEEVKALAEGTAFRSRDPQAAAPAPPGRREPRRYRTGRNVQLNLKVRQEAADAFYHIADQTGLVLGEVFEQAVEALARELSQGNSKAAR